MTLGSFRKDIHDIKTGVDVSSNYDYALTFKLNLPLHCDIHRLLQLLSRCNKLKKKKQARKWNFVKLQTQKCYTNISTTISSTQLRMKRKTEIQKNNEIRSLVK